MSVQTLLRSFAAGEITPELAARVDLVKFQTGLKIARNIVTLPHGPAQNRAGFEYVLETKDSSKASVLIPFIYNTEQAYMVEFGDQYVRFHVDGATVLEANQVITGITQANPGVVTIAGHGYSNGQWLYLADIGGMTELNGRWVIADGATANTFQLTDIHGGAGIDTTGYSAFTAGGTAARAYEIASPYLEADLFDLHFTQSADVLTITHQSYQQRELRRSGATSWAFSVIASAPTIDPPTGVTATSSATALAQLSMPTGLNATPSPGGTATSYTYKIAAVDLADERSRSEPAEIIATNDFSGAGAYIDLTWSAVAGATVYWVFADDLFLGETVGTFFRHMGEAGTDAVSLTAYTPPADQETLTYVVTSLKSEGLEESIASAEASCTNNLSVSGQYDDIAWSANADATRYNVYRKINGLFGYIGQTSELTFRDDNYTPDTSRTPPLNDDPFASVGNYPRAVGYFNGRRWFGGTTNKPQNIWATRSGTESNLCYSIPTRDDDRIAARLTARQANTIRHIVPADDLILLTSGTEWRIDALNSDAITPSTINPRTQDYIGASNVQPIVASGAVLYAQDRGGRVREMKYTWQSQKYDTTDISIMAPHLFDGYTITSMCYARAPNSCIWATRDDGTLLSLTYVPEHDVVAWHHHDTDGTFEFVASIPEGTEDVIYAIVKRTVNGRTVRYIERLHSRQSSALEDCFFVDAGATYNGTATDTLSGLWHLVGKTVSVLADGAVHPRVTVSATGTITLQRAASKVQVGLQYVSDIETLPLTLEVQAFGQALRKNVNRVHLRVRDSSGIFVGPSFDKLTEFKQRTTEPYGSPPALYTGIVRIATTPSWADDGNICIRQSDPLPLTVLGLVPEVA